MKAALLLPVALVAQSAPNERRYAHQPLVRDIYTADPAAHVFGGKLYVYASHNIESPPLPDVPPFQGAQGNAFKMRDYIALEMARPGGAVRVHRDLLKLEDVPWAARQLWAPDVAYKRGTYYLYFPAKDRAGAFRIGVATAKTPAGPFTARPQPIRGSYSIDPAVFTDDDGTSYMLFGGLSGGQLQKVVDGVYRANGPATDPRAPHERAFMPQIARLSGDMLEFAGRPRDATIVDADGKPLLSGDDSRRFFEGAWMHKHGGRYYLSYSTGGTHLLAYAVGDTPYGPFNWSGTILRPVQGWTTHGSTVRHGGRWWLFYADSQMSDKTWLRNVKVAPLQHDADGAIRPIDPFIEDRT